MVLRCTSSASLPGIVGLNVPVNETICPVASVAGSVRIPEIWKFGEEIVMELTVTPMFALQVMV